MRKHKGRKSPPEAKKSVFKIEKGIPIPEKKKVGKDVTCKYPLKDMEVGDSFIIENTIHSRQVSNSFSTSIRKQAKRLKIASKFTVLKDLNSDQIRVWRKA